MKKITSDSITTNLRVASYLIKSHHKIFKGVVLSILGGKNGCWDGCFEGGQGPLAFCGAQAPGQEEKIVNWQDPSVNILLLLHQDAGDFLWELDEGLQINQFLADPSWTWRKGTGIGHRRAWLAFWNKAAEAMVTLWLVFPTTDIWASQVVLENAKEPGDVRDMGLIPGLGRSPGGGHGNPLSYPCLENTMDRGAWLATVHRVAKSWTWLKQPGMHTCTRYLLERHSEYYSFLPRCTSTDEGIKKFWYIYTME